MELMLIIIIMSAAYDSERFISYQNKQQITIKLQRIRKEVKRIMNNKLILIGIAIAAVGLLALPQTLAMFAGQHDWYNKDELPCYKCHQAEYSEITKSEEHTGKACLDCHQYSGWKDTGAHAAVAVECLVCHGSGTAELDDVDIEINNASEAHKPFYLQSLNETASGWQTLSGANEACVMCHTHAGVDITFERRQGMKFNASINETGYWTFSGLTVYGTNLTRSNPSYINGSTSP